MTYWDYAPAFFDEIVPETVGRTLEVGCGEGRVTRDLRARGHDVYSIDGAPSLVLAAALADRTTADTPSPTRPSSPFRMRPSIVWSPTTS